MFGSYRIQPTTVDDLPALSRFLSAGFAAPPDSVLFAEPVLRWKYFEPSGIDFGPRSYLAWSSGEIVGHVGIVPRPFMVRGDAGALPAIPAVHFIDLLASPGHASAGLALMKRGFKDTPVQYALGGSSDGQRIVTITGYERKSEVPVMVAILQPTYRQRVAGLGRLARLARIGRDVAHSLAHRGSRPRRSLALQRVERFGPEIDALVADGPAPLVCTTRSAALLNYYLHYPSGTMTGFLLTEEARPVGFAVLNVVADQLVRRGKIVECFLRATDDDLWHAAITALRRELTAQRADIAIAYASTTWKERACLRAGFTARPQPEPFFLRDRERRLPREIPFHLTPLEADHAYL